MKHERGSQVEEPRFTGLLPGLNGVETCLTLSEEYGDLFGGRKLMERERVRDILRTLNEAQIHYAIIGGVAMGYHSIPRATQDIDVLVSREDIPRVQRLLQPYYRRGTAVVMVFDVEGTHLDVLPATLRYGRTAIENAVEVLVHDIPAKVVSVRDLLLLKLFAIPDRPALTSYARMKLMSPRCSAKTPTPSLRKTSPISSVTSWDWRSHVRTWRNISS